MMFLSVLPSQFKYQLLNLMSGKIFDQNLEKNWHYDCKNLEESLAFSCLNLEIISLTMSFVSIFTNDAFQLVTPTQASAQRVAKYSVASQP